MPKNIIIIGGGGHAKMCIDILKQNIDYNIIGIIDRELKINDTVLGIKVIGTDKDLQEIFNSNTVYAVNGIGGGSELSIRKKIYITLKEIGFILPPIIHKSAVVEPSSILQDGCQIMAGAIIGSNALICENCIINSGAIVSHDCIIHKHSHITPGAILAGNIEVGEKSIVGMGATVFYGLKIGNNVIINNGQNVFRNIEDNYRLKEKI